MAGKKPIVIDSEPSQEEFLLDQELPIGGESVGELNQSTLERRPTRVFDYAERELQKEITKAGQTTAKYMTDVRFPKDVGTVERMGEKLAGFPQRMEQIPDKYRLKPGGYDPIHRCSSDDIIRFAPKVVSRLHERFPRISESNFISHYGAILAANWAIVICSDTAIAAATAFSTWYEPELVVQDSLLCSVEPVTGGADIIRLYKRIEEWARSIGAVEITIGSMTEKDLGPLASRLSYNMVSRGFSKRLKE